MQIFIGPFHPHLEEKLVTEIQQIKSPDPLTPLLILVPSDSIRQYLMKTLVLDHRLSLINLSILTFHQLSWNLVQEKMEAEDFTLQDDLFFEETLRLLTRPTDASTGYFSSFYKTEGGPPALWKTLRDLKEGRVDPDVAISALKEGVFGKEASTGKYFQLFNLYQKLKKRDQKQQILDYGDLATLSIHRVKTTPFLKQFRAIFYYGFYDLTQVQIDLLHEVSYHYPTILFFPLIRKQSGWSFSEQFFERYVEGLITNSAQINDLTAETADYNLFPHDSLFNETADDFVPQSATALSCEIISCFDMQNEVLTVAKEIVRLTDDCGVAFSEIGVIAREMDGYLTPIKTLFQKHAIPMTSPCNEPLIQHPFSKTVFLLTRLLLEDFPRALCIDLVTTPFFNIASFHSETTTAQPDLWDFLTRKAKITKGIAQWQHLQEPDPIGLQSTGQSEQALLLWTLISSLYQDLTHLPLKASWSDYSVQWEALLTKYLGLPPLDSLDQNGKLLTQETRISVGIHQILDRLAELDRVSDLVSRQDYIEAFRRGLTRGTVPFADPNISGVSVMDIMSARGIPYRFIFTLGLNEGRFPRSIREDPILQDRHRHILETDLGYKVGEKLAGYDEERLLFILLTGSAKEKFYALYHRTDDLGNPENPSWYISELRNVFQKQDTHLQNTRLTERTIPRSYLERQSVSPYHRADLLLPSEWVIQANLNVQNPEAMLKHLPFSPDLYHHGQTALQRLEDHGPLTAQDGLIGSGKADWENMTQRGIAPTRLENYARCPYQFFTTHLLKLSKKETPEAQVALTTLDIGALCHKILAAFYSQLHQEGYFSHAEKAVDIEKRVRAISGEIFALYDIETESLYPVYRDVLKSQIVTLLHQVISIDLKELAASGFHPAAFELDCRKQIEADWPKMIGRIDRIDFNPEAGKIRVIDYKVNFRKSPKLLEKNLLLSALRGVRLQAPIYLRFAEEYAEDWEENTGDQTTAYFYYLAPNWPGGPLVISKKIEEADWQGETGRLLKETISTLLQYIEAGHFFMKPGEDCAYCDVVEICRKSHSPSRIRLEKDPIWKTFQSLQKKKKPDPLKTKQSK